MFKKIGCLVLLNLCVTFAYAGDEPTTLPTEASKPIPKMSKVHNIDTVLAETIQQKLTKTPSLDGQAISAASVEQVITLQGSVDTQSQADAAIAIAKSVKGVKKVNSQLTVKGSPNQ